MMQCSNQKTSAMDSNDDSEVAQRSEETLSRQAWQISYVYSYRYRWLFWPVYLAFIGFVVQSSSVRQSYYYNLLTTLPLSYIVARLIVSSHLDTLPAPFLAKAAIVVEALAVVANVVQIGTRAWLDFAACAPLDACAAYPERTLAWTLLMLTIVLLLLHVWGLVAAIGLVRAITRERPNTSKRKTTRREEAAVGVKFKKPVAEQFDQTSRTRATANSTTTMTQKSVKSQKSIPSLY